MTDDKVLLQVRVAPALKKRVQMIALWQNSNLQEWVTDAIERKLKETDPIPFDDEEEDN